MSWSRPKLIGSKMCCNGSPQEQTMKERLTVSLDPDVLAKLRVMAERERRSISSMVEVILDKALNPSPIKTN